MTDTAPFHDLASEVLDIARAKGQRLVTAESCTGGMVAAALTDIPGSSDVVIGGWVSYSNAAKCAMLGVLETTLEAHGAVSEEVACEMADGALYTGRGDLAVAITGIAGPGGSEHKPEGRVCFAIARATEIEDRSVTKEFGAIGRDEVRRAATRHALEMLRDALNEE
ncbi:CinA family protein [Litorisediminicola beolgyonensis]|uniref:CinA family protein n=1 Tax=Litorisediminicola beolgyonensis TaxID=1173614 RepID=A0ABW3ZK37_9RHOB